MKPREARTQFLTKDGREVTIRALRRGYLAALTRFVNAVSREKAVNRELGIVSFGSRIARKEELKFLKRVLREGKKRNVASFAALSGRAIVGYADVWRRPSRDVHHTGVFGVVILQGYRSVGIGERLMREAMQEADALGIWPVELTVFAANVGAIHLYEKIGFRRVGVVRARL